MFAFIFPCIHELYQSLLFNYGKYMIFYPILLLSLNVPRYVLFLLWRKIDLEQPVAVCAWEHNLRCFSTKWNNVLVQCVLSGFLLPFNPHPPEAHCISHSRRIRGNLMSVNVSTFKGMPGNLFTSGRVASGKSASGGSACCYYSCLSPLS